MKIEVDKQTREKVLTKYDTNRLEAGSFILDPDGNRIPNLKDSVMKARKKLEDEKNNKNSQNK